MDHELAELIQSVDPGVLGARIKTARIAAGLRQHQLAEGVSSVPYISRIEGGARRPGLDLLAIIAERTGTTPAALLRGLSDDEHAQVDLELTYAELELNAGDVRAATSRLAHVHSLLPPDYKGALSRRARRLGAGAHEALGDLDAAITDLEALLEDEADDATWLALATTLSRCYRQAGQLRAAVEIGERAQSRLSSLQLEGTTEGIQLGLTVAGALFELGDVAEAIHACRRAIDRAEAIDSPGARAAAYWNASIIESRRGNTAAALSFARTALPLLESANDARNVARLHGQLGILQLRDGDAATARATLLASVAALDASSASAADRARARIALAESELALGDIAAARDTIDAISRLDVAGTPLVDAERAMLLGRIAVASDDRVTGIEHYRAALAILNGVAADRGVGEAWFELATLLDEAGDADDAQAAYRAAAASAGFAARTSARLTRS